MPSINTEIPQSWLLEWLACALDSLVETHPAHSSEAAYPTSASAYLSQALESADHLLSIDCSHLLIRDAHDPEMLLVGTSSAKGSIFHRVRLSGDSSFFSDLTTDLSGQELDLERRRYKDDRAWELLWQSMTVGPYTGPWSIIGLPLDPSAKENRPSGYLLFIGPRYWYSNHPNFKEIIDRLLRDFSHAGKVVRVMSYLSAMSSWSSNDLTSEMATAGKLHNILSSLQRMELKLTLAEDSIRKSLARHEVLSSLEQIRLEVFEIDHGIQNFIDIRTSSPIPPVLSSMLPNQYADLENVIKNVIGSLNTLAITRKKAFVSRCQGAPKLRINESDLELILKNLLHNAVKYGYPGTKIKIGAEVRGQLCLIDVTSYGIIIRPSDRERIFDQKFRTPEASKIEYTAAGLGLFAARRTAELWGGHLFLRTCDLDAETLNGNRYRSTFRLELPC